MHCVKPAEKTAVQRCHLSFLSNSTSAWKKKLASTVLSQPFKEHDMITLLNIIDSCGASQVEVLLDIGAKDFAAPSPTLKKLLTECKTTKRKVGCISRTSGATTFFTYDPANQAQVEASLIAALSIPKSEVHVTQERSSEWANY
jgi:hypothetical protein